MEQLGTLRSNSIINVFTFTNLLKEKNVWGNLMHLKLVIMSTARLLSYPEERQLSSGLRMVSATSRRVYSVPVKRRGVQITE